MIFAVIMFIAICAYAYIETHADRIMEEIQIRRLIRQSWEDARHIGRSPTQYGSTGYCPQRRRR